MLQTLKSALPNFSIKSRGAGRSKLPLRKFDIISRWRLINQGRLTARYMSTNTNNPYVWDRPFAFLWLSAEDDLPLHVQLSRHIREVAEKTDPHASSLLPHDSASNGGQSLAFEPHITLHTTQLDEKNIVGSLEDAIRKTTKLSSSAVSPLSIRLTAPIKGHTHFKSVFVDVDRQSTNIEGLHQLKDEAKKIFGDNIPPEETYLPHLSLWYGTDEQLRAQAFVRTKSGPLAAGIDYPLSHIHLVYAPHQDLRSWKIIGSTRIGCDVFFRRTAFIDGNFEALRNAEAFIVPSSFDRIPIINPATGENMGIMEGCQHEATERAIGAAKRAFRKWNYETTLAQRLAIIRRLSALIRERSGYLSKMETTDNGKPLKEAELDVSDTADCFDYFASLAESDKKLNGEGDGKISVDNNQIDCRVIYDAVGVCAMILPFNYPLLMAAWKVAPALAAGCTVIVKPSEVTSATALELAALAHEAGVPAGVLNVLPGLGSSVGPTLTSSPEVRKIAFTGSGATGKQILRESTQFLPNVSLELGGKSPAILFEDSDINEAIDWLLVGIFFNAGQVCSATSRLLIQSSIYDQVKTVLVEKAKKLAGRVGNGLKPDTLLGPLVSELQYQRVKNLVKQGIQEGATVLCGEQNFGDKVGRKKGFFFYPTILEHVEAHNTLWLNEVFGPVLVIRKFDTEEEAVALANETRYGLASAVFTSSEERQQRVVKQLDTGIIWINCSQPTLVQAPWGGMKESGIGRELGPWGLENFLEAKQVTKWTAKENWGWYSDL